ncbi:hypothetical protein J437_LFUL017301 [Ladona fulva]|uniref:Retrotransposon gag domain-containing protein n=1 Tax=Ladona fulva TaxID=123851 RepID=A0A8K0KJ92_LADFU|nr:hypothetical protein J437_LFUL017301 [Ladona fulva]
MTYKDCTNMTDENALRGLSMILEGVAATWWHGVKATVSDWSAAVSSLRNTFTRRLPPHLVFREILAREQHDDESCELLVCHFRALVAQLPYPLPERIQLDMLHGLLHRRIRKRLSSDGLESFASMLKRAKEIKHLKRESASQTAATRPTTDKMADRKPRPRCSYGATAVPLGVYHESALTPFVPPAVRTVPAPLKPIRRRGRPHKTAKPESTAPCSARRSHRVRRSLQRLSL